MFNLLIGYADNEDEIDPGHRLLESTEESVRKRLGNNYVSTLLSLPTLSMPELQGDASGKVARVGTITTAYQTSSGPVFRFLPNLKIDPIPAETIRTLAGRLAISSKRWGEFDRTHWAVKNVDLYEVLLEHHQTQGKDDIWNYRTSSGVQWPVNIPRDPKLVAVMMPFADQFDFVHQTIQQAVEDATLTSVRVDDIWKNELVMDDVLSVIWKAEIVVADLTTRNPNVFYEVGMARAIKRKTILLTQSLDDVPFDLRSIRVIEYGGIATKQQQELRERLNSRLTQLLEL